MANKICQISFKILPNAKYTLKILPKTLNILPNFASSGHTGPKHTIFAFINLYLNCIIWKRRKYTLKEARICPLDAVCLQWRN